MISRRLGRLRELPLKKAGAADVPRNVRRVMVYRIATGEPGRVIEP
jgi:hypothetical protein